MQSQPWWRPAFAEFLGTFALVFIGAGSLVVLSRANLVYGGQQVPSVVVGVALAHGLAIATMVMALGHVSGAHFNPAVTVAMMFTRRMRADTGFLYVLFQLLGGVAAAFLLVTSLPSDWWDVPGVHLGTPALATGVGMAKGVLLEAVLTFFLVLVVFAVAVDARNPNKLVAGLAIGLTIAMDIFVGGYVTGGALNPARAFGPALISRSWDHHAVYWIGPLLGGILAGLVYDGAFIGGPRKSDAVAAPDAPPTPPA